MLVLFFTLRWGVGLVSCLVFLSSHPKPIQINSSMLAEVLLSLSGHPSSLFSSTTLGSTSTSSLSTFPSLPLHPSEIESLKSLQLLSSRYARIREFSKNQLDLVRRTSLRNAGVRVSRNKKGKEKQQENQDNHLSSHLSPLCSTLLNILKEYEDLILGLQKIILERREEPTGAATFKVAKDGFVSLNSIKALVSTSGACVEAEGLCSIHIWYSASHRIQSLERVRASHPRSSSQ